ncbi:MAG TPA: ribulose-phosphate 3-epimerase [Bacteroidales bacterium]|jgi:ribulose-phosphate 3-epimerase|nr:ribulose-phosphate 3-epimerase [Bacteroidales bacterium]MDI9533213.1 ribulose-phosphate 3-epimerase [Bacteroidota bacterium]OPZ57983.1 MAG: Ribulose-phosphate 3-epimerase [Bacteroidetes bacterium ADurb.BinA012]MZQ78566.1 ribulose-phosphate 3-epimerase [Bacteroidales bacterium]HHU99210.1 ribulose-phosphate 3-epimerase [Bacteroidales bacterium]
MSHLVAPSLLAADFANLASEVEMINDSEADWIHLDIMDGLFVPNISFGFPVVEAVSDLASKPLDVHLMIVDPDRYLERFRDAGASYLTVQFEACNHLHRTVTEIRRLGMKAGVALNPHSPVILIKDILPYIDMVLLMTVNPGYGGQTFIPGSFNKIGELRSMIDEGGYEVLIEVDGGVDLHNAPMLVHAGVDVLVAGSTVFSSSDPAETIRRLREPV